MGKVLLALICVLVVASNILSASSEDPASGQGDVLVALVDVVQSPPMGTPIFSGDKFTITYVVENVGKATAPDFTFKIPNLPKGLELVEEATPQMIPPGEKARFTFEFQAATEGEYELTAQAFESGQLIGSVSLTIIILKPITIIQPIRVTTSPKQGERVYPGDYVRYTVTLQNLGNVPARSVEFKPTKVPEGVELVEKSPPAEIKPGETKDFTLIFLCKEAGLYEIPLVTVVEENTLAYGTLTISVTAPSSLTRLLLIALAAIVIIVTFALIYRRKKRTATAPPSTTAPPTEPPSAFCIHCGAPIAESDKFCRKCGSPQQE